MQRVQKILSNAGVMSRRKAEQAIEEGRVKVNGKKITIGDQADPEKDDILLDDKKVKFEKKRYLMLNKPKGYLSTLNDPSDKKTIMELIGIDERVFPIGRLDYNTRGLLLMTNDGDFANLMMHPRYEIKKTYLVEINRPLSRKDRSKLQEGIYIDEQKTHPAIVTELDRRLYEIIIHEGRNRIIKRMFYRLGYKVLELARTRIGNLKLDVREGRYRDLKDPEIRQLRELTAQ